MKVRRKKSRVWWIVTSSSNVKSTGCNVRGEYCINHEDYLRKADCFRGIIYLGNKNTITGLLRPCSVQFSHSVVSDSLQPHEPQHTRPPCPSPTPRVHPNPYPSSWWCHPTISSSVVPFSSYLQSFPASGSFQMSVLHIRWPKYWSFSFSISPSNEHSGLISFRMDWFYLLAVKELSRVFSRTTVQKHQFFSAQLSL